MGVFMEIESVFCGGDVVGWKDDAMRTAENGSDGVECTVPGIHR
jgi:hypothetical protein